MKSDDPKTLCVAWLVPSVARGTYWQPILREFTKLCHNTIFYAGDTWPDFDQTAPGAAVVKVVGRVKFVASRPEQGYSRGFIYVSPNIIFHLLKLKPDLIFASGFSLWTLLAIITKPLGRWKIAIIYDGSSPNVDTSDSKLRLFARRFMAAFTDILISNTEAGAIYFKQTLGINSDKIIAKPYLVPDAQTLLQTSEEDVLKELQLSRPLFLSVGKVVPRKGIAALLEACGILNDRGCQNYSLLIIGDGWQREELQIKAREKGVEAQITWLDWVEYSRLGNFFNYADVFVFPSLEDVWGMVVPEAMVFGKPVLCSKWAGAVEMVMDGENGYIFDPYNPEELADQMACFMQQPDLATLMGHRSQSLIDIHTPVAVAQFFNQVALQLVKQKINSNQKSEGAICN